MDYVGQGQGQPPPPWTRGQGSSRGEACSWSRQRIAEV